jgi:hypothetical protein
MVMDVCHAKDTTKDNQPQLKKRIQIKEIIIF